MEWIGGGGPVLSANLGGTGSLVDGGLRPGAQGGLDFLASLAALCDALARLTDHLVDLASFTWAVRGGLPWLVGVELGSAGEGGLVDPAPGDAVGQYVASGVLSTV